jgi:hypothetical protein
MEIPTMKTFTPVGDELYEDNVLDNIPNDEDRNIVN